MDIPRLVISKAGEYWHLYYKDDKGWIARRYSSYSDGDMKLGHACVIGYTHPTTGDKITQYSQLCEAVELGIFI